MNDNQSNFFTAKYSDLSQRRIGFYSILVATGFGVVGIITGDLKKNVIGGCVAIVFIHILGKWCDFSRSGSLERQLNIQNMLGFISLCTFIFLVLIKVIGSLLKMI